jgi:anti-anti-sigma factor
MEITVSHEKGRVDITIFKLNGLLNLGTTSKLDNKAKEEYDAGMRYLLIDLSELDSITSAGLRSIHAIYKMLHSKSPVSKEGEDVKKSEYLKLLNPQPQINRVLNIAGFDLFIEIFDNQQEAINSF